jgi:hypothetical protein
MLGTLNDGVYNFKHLASVIRLQIPTLPKTTTKVVFETLNTAITGTYTADVTDETPTLEALEATGNSVTVNFSEALTADITDARILIPVPAGTLTGGFRISVYEGSTLYSSYTTYKDKTATRNKLMLYTLYPNTEAATTDDGGVVAFDENNATAATPTTNTHTLTSGDWVMTNTKSAFNTADSYYMDGYLYYSNNENTLTIPTDKEITKITFVGYGADTTAPYIATLGNLSPSTTDFVFPRRISKSTDTQSIRTHTIIPKTAFTGSIKIKFSKKSYMKIYVTYKNSATE